MGLRVGEVLALRVTDVDLARRIIRVRQTVDAAYGHVVGNQQREAVESRSARIAKYAASYSIVSKPHFVSKKEIKCC